MKPCLSTLVILHRSGLRFIASDLFSCVKSHLRYHLKLLHARKKEPGGWGWQTPTPSNDFLFKHFLSDVVFDYIENNIFVCK